ncbi:MAG: hypothetical protein KDC53_09625, partial [Saprospiraceae bacterium]|nr:hypothetical protein [Saprospiraceae bacterium]
ERSVDEVARDAMANLEVPYQADSWDHLSGRLDRINYRKRLIASKVFEAAVIFFAIFTMVKFLGQIPEVQELLLPNAMVGTEEYLEQEHDPSKSKSNPDDLKPAQAVTTSTFSDPEVKGDQLTDKTTSVDLAFLPLPATPVKPGFSVRPLEGRKVAVANPIPSLDLHLLARVPVVNTPMAYENIQKLPVFDMAMLQAETANDFHVLAASKPLSKVKTKVGVFHQRNVNLIDRLKFVIGGGYNEEQTLSNDIENGFVANVQFGRFGFDIGGSYGKVNYNAGDSETSIEKLQIPLNLRYTGIKTKYADFYALAGASAHAVLRANYAEPSQSAAPGATSNNQRSAYNDGLLEGGFKEGNTYYTLNGGIGVDIPITKNLAIFAESIYQHHWKESIGYTDDKISTYTYKIGVSTKL